LAVVVDVPGRLEKRLVALLNDLAEYKRLAVNSCLEKTLLPARSRVDGGADVADHQRGMNLLVLDVRDRWCRHEALLGGLVYAPSILRT
jgi:hypothetical protein